VRETVSLYEAKTKLSELVERAARGEEIVIAKSGKPRASGAVGRCSPSARARQGTWTMEREAVV